MEEKNELDALREKLLYKQKQGYDIIDVDERIKLEEYATAYKAYLNAARTEREAVTEAIAQAEALGQGGLFGDGLGGVHLVIAPVAEVLPDQVAAVGGGIDDHVGRPLLQTALQNGLHGGIGLVVLVKGQIVDEQDKFLTLVPQGAHQLGQAGEILLLDLDEAQVLHAGEIEHGFHRGRLARAPVAEEEDVVGIVPGHHLAGVGLHLAALLLIAQQVLRFGAVRVGHGDQLAVLPQEGPIAGIQPRPVVPIELDQAVKVEGGGGDPAGHGLYHRGLLRGQQGGDGRQDGAAVQTGQGQQGVHVPAGGLLQGGGGAVRLGGEGKGGLGVAQLVPQPVPDAGEAPVAQGLEQTGIGGQGVFAPLGPLLLVLLLLAVGQGIEHGGGIVQDRFVLIVQQRAISGQAPQGIPQRRKVHVVSLPFLFGFSLF